MKGPISNFILEHYKHFNAAALVDAAQGYEQQGSVSFHMNISTKS
jgi:deoxyhypusine synthase